MFAALHVFLAAAIDWLRCCDARLCIIFVVVPVVHHTSHTGGAEERRRRCQVTGLIPMVVPLWVRGAHTVLTWAVVRSQP